MNYEEKYRKALDAAKMYYKENKDFGADFLPIIFPELKESEDERIRKSLIEYLENSRNSVISRDRANSWISWLEKQKPVETPQWMIDFLYGYRKQIGHSMDYDEIKEIDGRILTILGWLKGNPNIEQKSVEWSEDDEKQIRQIERIVKDSGASTNLQNKISDWLKSIKPNHWKPSKEHLIYLKEAINKFDFCDSESAGLQSLYNDLEKL